MSPEGMTADEKYLFDVHGFVVIKDLLSNDEVVAANLAVDAHADQIQLRPNDLSLDSKSLQGNEGRGDLGGMLSWDPPHCDPFRQMIAHPKSHRFLKELCGPGYRLEGFSMITMNKGAEGFWFHEGGEPHDRSRGYLYRNGRMFAGMTNIAVQLTNVGPGDGGFACVPGSHRANFPCPDDIRLYETHKDRFVQVAARAGDGILFCECLMHGAFPWVAEHQRRSVVIRYNNGTQSEGVMGTWTPPAFYDELTEDQKAVISQPRYRGEDKGSALYKPRSK